MTRSTFIALVVGALGGLGVQLAMAQPVNGCPNSNMTCPPIKATTVTATTVNGTTGNFQFVDAGIGYFHGAGGTLGTAPIQIDQPGMILLARNVSTGVLAGIVSNASPNVSIVSQGVTSTFSGGTLVVNTQLQSGGNLLAGAANAADGLIFSNEAEIQWPDTKIAEVGTGLVLTASGGVSTPNGFSATGTISTASTLQLSGTAGIYFSNTGATSGIIGGGTSAANMSATVPSVKVQAEVTPDADDAIFCVKAGLSGAGGCVSIFDNEGDITTAGREVHTAQALTCAAGGGACALTITPSSSIITVDCQDADTCDVTMSETGAVAGSRTCITIIGATGATDFADSAGVLEIAGAFAAGIADTICLVYVNSAWHEISRSNN